MQALLDIIAALVLWTATAALAQFGIEADFLRPAAHESPAPPSSDHPRETPAACPGHDVQRTRIHDV